jgi:hypothetical protein
LGFVVVFSIFFSLVGVRRGFLVFTVEDLPGNPEECCALLGFLVEAWITEGTSSERPGDGLVDSGCGEPDTDPHPLVSTGTCGADWSEIKL